METVTVYNTPRQRVARLRELGIPEEILLRAVSDGFAARRNCTPNHPPQAAGWYTWAETTRSLRDQLVVLKWTRAEQGGVSLIVNPSKTIAIAVTTGDENTGQADSTPRSKNTKGASAIAAIANNQLNFGAIILGTNPESSAPPTPWKTYYLLVAMVDGEGQSELSLPDSIGVDQCFDKWIERIPLSPTSWNEPDSVDDNAYDVPDLDVPVTRIGGNAV